MAAWRQLTFFKRITSIFLSWQKIVRVECRQWRWTEDIILQVDMDSQRHWCSRNATEDRAAAATRNRANRNRVNVATIERPTGWTLRRLTLVIRVTHGKITLFPFRKRATCTPRPFRLASCRPPGPRKPACRNNSCPLSGTPFPSLFFFLQLPFRCILQHPRSFLFVSPKSARACEEPVHLRPEKFFSFASVCESSRTSAPRVNFTHGIFAHTDIKDRWDCVCASYISVCAM